MDSMPSNTIGALKFYKFDICIIGLCYILCMIINGQVDGRLG